MSKIDMLNQVFEEVNQICLTNKTNIWTNSWSFEKSLLKYYHLIYQEYDGTFHYKNVNDLQIDVCYDTFHDKYRIDIRSKYQRHNYWLFNEDKYLLIKEYVKRLIRVEYDFLQQMYLLLELSDGAYINKEPALMYQKINSELRKQKLKKLNYEKI